MLEDPSLCSLLLPSVLVSSIFMLLFFTFFDWNADKARMERRLRREKILKNTKAEAIKQAREPIKAARKPGDVEREGLGRVIRNLESCVVRNRV